MFSRYIKSLLPLAAVATLALPTLAQAHHGSDDPANHVRREHHRVVHHRVVHVHHRADDGAEHGRHGSDDGPNHR